MAQETEMNWMKVILPAALEAFLQWRMWQVWQHRSPGGWLVLRVVLSRQTASGWAPLPVSPPNKHKLQTNYCSYSNINICVLFSTHWRRMFSFLYLSFEPSHLLLLPFITTFPFFSCKFFIDAYNVLNSFSSEKCIKSEHSVCKHNYCVICI